MLIGSEVYSIVSYFRKTDSMAIVTTGACAVVTWVKMKSLFYKNKLEIGVTRAVFKQVTNYSRNPLYRHLIIMGGILFP